MNEDQIKHMVNRFLTWRLPEDFHPDCGIFFDADAAKKMNPINSRYEPVGTNLFSAVQATKMVRYMIEGAPAPLSAPADGVTDALIKSWKDNARQCKQNGNSIASYAWSTAASELQAALTAKVRG